MRRHGPRAAASNRLAAGQITRIPPWMQQAFNMLLLATGDWDPLQAGIHATCVCVRVRVCVCVCVLTRLPSPSPPTPLSPATTSSTPPLSSPSSPPSPPCPPSPPSISGTPCSKGKEGCGGKRGPQFDQWLNLWKCITCVFIQIDR
jgi:hypothetical protein